MKDKLFEIRDSFPCHVTYIYHVRGMDEDDALENFYNSQAECMGHRIGEVVSFLDHGDIEVEEIVAPRIQAEGIDAGREEVLERTEETSHE